MKKIATVTLAGLLGFAANTVAAQQTSTKQTNPTQNKDIPREQPGTNNPDMAQQHHDTSQPDTAKKGKKSKRSHHRKHQSSNTAGSTKSTT